MDRWIDADDDTHCAKRKVVQGVAAGGLAAFVKSGNTTGTEGAQTFGKIEIVASKRERKAAELKAEATRLMPPPRLPGAGGPPVESIPVAEGPPKCPVPSWAGEPPAGCRLLVYKEGAVIQDIALGKIVTVFGRVPELADVVLDHPSISRQHATAAWHPGRGVWLLTDLGSTHGTWVGEQRLAKNEPVELRPGVELRFAASTRRYKLAPLGGGGLKAAEAAASGGDPAAASGQGSGSGSGLMPPPPPKRPRVSFADDAAAAAASDADGGGAPRRTALETVIGFTDGKDFVRVGPRAAAPEEGRFAAAVSSATVVRIAKPSRPGDGGGNSSAGGAGEVTGVGAALGAAAEGAAGAGAGGGGGGGAMAPPPPRKAPGSPRPGCGRGASLTRAASGSGGGSSADEDEEKEEAAAAGGAQGSGATGTGEGGPGRASALDTANAVIERRGSGGTGGAAAAGADEVRPQLRDFVDRLRKAPPKVGGSDSLYAALPPPSK